MKYKCIIIDDELHAIEGLERYIATIPELQVIKTFNDPVLALKEIPNLAKVDLIFLDVDMPMINGIELAKEIRNKTHKLVFTTGHRSYAFEAFEAQVDAYLLKPYSLGKFTITINKLFPAPQLEQTPSPLEEKEQLSDFFFVKSKSERLRLVKIRFNDVIMVESKAHNIKIFTLTDELTTYMSLTDISKTLFLHDEFIQPNRSYIINLNHIKLIEGDFITMVNAQKISIGEHYRKRFTDFIQQRVLKGTKK